MKKKDLKNGMLAISSRYEYIVAITKKGGIFIRKGEIIPFRHFNEDLTHLIREVYNITEVYDKPDVVEHMWDFGVTRDLLWKREEEIPFVTLDGIGYSEQTLRSIIKKGTQ